MLKNYFSEMDNKISNILEINKKFHNEACILMITYLDELSNYTMVGNKYGRNDNKKKFIHFVRDYSNMKEYTSFVLMHKIYIAKDKAIKESYRSACTMIYEEYKDRFQNFFEKIKKDSEVLLTDSLLICDIEKIKDIQKCFGKNEDEYHNFLRKISFGELFYEFRSYCVHEHRNKFHLDIYDEPYYIYINCLEGDGYVSFEIPFEFMYKVLIECYNKVRSEFNYNMNTIWNWENDKEI